MIQAIFICMLFILLGLLSLILALRLAQHLTSRPISISKLLVGLEPKLVMTAGLGFFFVGFYVSVVYITSQILTGEMRQKIFEMALNYPTYFIYGGLFLFILISIGILGVRSVIKKLYNSRK